MVFYHVVLVKAKAELKADAAKLEEFKKDITAKIRALDVAKKHALELEFGPPAFPERAGEYDYGLISKFESKAAYAPYQTDAAHLE